jgi:formate dehydrogenase major subunit
VPFCYYEAAINRLTNAALDPFAKIPEFKYCAIRVTRGGDAPAQGSYGGGQARARQQIAVGGSELVAAP